MDKKILYPSKKRFTLSDDETDLVVKTLKTYYQEIKFRSLYYPWPNKKNMNSLKKLIKLFQG